jgi:crotonobetainyl-CoA:carnitine CoA-transferase CaiB-like acyl-CoA transferase
MQPLEDLRIIAIEQYGAGPFGSSHLADMGAEVIKIENPRSGGDVGRKIPIYLEEGDSLYFQTLNRNKKSLALDIQSPAGREVLHSLIAKSDAVWSNLRGDGPERVGIRYEDLKHINPRIVCCSLSGFGMTGPRRDQASYDYAIQAMTGWMSVTGEPGGPPTKHGLSLVDWSTGYVAALSLMIGIHAARRDGVGTDCDVSLFDTAINLLTYYATWQQTKGYEPVRTALSSHPTIVPFGNFQTSDGWVTVCCPNPEFWQKFAQALGLERLVDDPRFLDFSDRWENKDELLKEIDSVMLTGTTSEWVERLIAADVPCSRVNSVAEALAEEQAVARGAMIEFDHPVYGPIRAPRSAVRVGELSQTTKRAPQLNEHAGEILHDLLGLSESEVADLTKSGAFGQPQK